MTQVPTVGHAILCPKCGYDLRATALGGACPECGLPVRTVVDGIRVEGKYLVVRDEAALPARCVKTNESVEDKPITKTFYWSHPAWALLILVNLLLALIVIMIVRKKCRLSYYLTRTQKAKQRNRMLIAIGSLLVGLVGGLAAVVNEYWIIACIGLGLFLLGLVLIVAWSGPIKITKMRNGEFWIKGCDRTFLDSLENDMYAGITPV